jgi:hypothetical protein
MYAGLSPSARSEVCKRLAESEEELFDRLKIAAQTRDLKTADETTEELKWNLGSEAETCERER